MTAAEFVDGLDNARSLASNAGAMWPSGLALPALDRCIDELERLLLATADDPDAFGGDPPWWWHL